jgi:hypothetical protein
VRLSNEAPAGPVLLESDGAKSGIAVADLDPWSETPRNVAPPAEEGGELLVLPAAAGDADAGDGDVAGNATDGGAGVADDVDDGTVAGNDVDGGEAAAGKVEAGAAGAAAGEGEAVAAAAELGGGEVAADEVVEGVVARQSDGFDEKPGAEDGCAGSVPAAPPDGAVVVVGGDGWDE